MALPLKSLVVFAAVMVGAGLLTASSLNRTASVVSETPASTPAVTKTLKPNYIARMPTAAETAALNIAKALPVKPRVTIAPTQIAAPPPLEVVEADLTVTARPSYSHQVVASGANVRSGPKKSFPQVFTLRQGSWVNIGENVQGWIKVTDETGREGWVHGSLLQAANRTVVAAD